MSSIDDLKVNAEAQKERVDIVGVTARNKPIASVKRSNNEYSSNRVEIDLTEMPKEAPPEDIRESFTKDLLEGEDSVFGKYLKEKKEEYVERMATYEQEREMIEEEAEQKATAEDGEGELGFESVAYEVQPSNNIRFSVDEDDEMEENINIEVQSEDISELDESDTIDDIEEFDPVVEEAPVEETTKVKEEKEEIEAPEIDLEVKEVAVDNSENRIVEDDESENEVDQDEVLAHLKKLATEKLKPVSRNLNISSFTILKKPTANIKGLETETVKAAKWVLLTQGSIVMMKEFLGSELEDLRDMSEDGSSVSQLYRKFKCIYDHIVSPKPATYDAWLKSTPYADVDHYFFAVFVASFKGSNFLPLDCVNDKCRKTFITDDIPILKMVKFDTKEAKTKFTNIYDNEIKTTGKGLYVSEIVPLSNKIAIGFKDASIYNLFEIASLSNQDKDKYSSIIEYIPYIDALYIIDQENSTLTPVGYKIFPENANKTVKSKIRTFFNVLKNLSVDEFSVIRSYIREITTKNEGISYKNPSVNCPYCGKETVEQPMSAEALVFLRSQLSSLVNTSLK